MRILIVHPYGIGDVLFSLPLVAALRDSFPDGFVGYLCNRRTESLVRSVRMLDWVEVFEKDEFRAAWGRSKREGLRFLNRTIREVHRQRFDLLVDLSLGWHVGCAGWLAGIPERIGFDYRGRGRFLTKRLPITGFHDRPVAAYEMDLLSLLGIEKPPLRAPTVPITEAVSKQARELLFKWGIPPGSKLLGVVPGGGASWGMNAIFKQWPPEHFARAADHLSDRYGLTVLLIGDEKEYPLCNRVAAGMKRPSFQVVEISSLLVLAGLLKECLLVLGNDSGPMHLAAAVGTKTVSIFGPVDPLVYGPFGRPEERSSHRIVTKALACRPCYRNFKFPPCPWDNACLKKLEVSSVLEAVDEALS